MVKKFNTPLNMLFAFLLSVLLTCAVWFTHNNCGEEWLFYIFIFFVSVDLHFLIMFISAPIVSLLFRKRFNYNCLWFKQGRFETKLYRTLRVKRWKTLLPTYHTIDYSTKHYNFETVIQNMCHAEVVHEVITLTSYLAVLFGLIVSNYGLLILFSAIFSTLHMPFIIVQRYNRPRILKIYSKRLLLK